MAWVFQGNPRIFDVEDYISRYPELIYWRTPRHQSQISVGDRAVIWRSGKNAGAIAIGTVVEAPTPGTKVKHPEALADDLWRAEEPDPADPLTGIHLEEVRLTPAEGFVSRDLVRADSLLAQATLITMPNGTIFPLNEAQTRALEHLWGMSASPFSSVKHEAMEGGERIVSHYRRERSSSLREKKLAEIRALHGKCICALCGIAEGSTYPSALGERIFEVHHISPLAAAATPARTTLDDLAVLCANCHRAVHATTSVEENYEVLARYFREES